MLTAFMAAMIRSIEPGRRKAYSVDLQWRVVWQRMALGFKYHEIATNLGISLGTAYNVIKLFEATGEVSPKTGCKRHERGLDNYHEMSIIGLVLDSPQLQLTELIMHVKEATNKTVDTSTICRLLARFGFTRKKLQRVALQRSLTFQATFVANTYIFSRDRFVWVDETGCNYKDMLRKHGYSSPSERAVSETFMIRGQRISCIAAISTEGLLALETTSNSVNGDMFF